MEPRQRIVTRLDLPELWNAQGPLKAAKQRDVSESEIRALLRKGPLQFVVADLGHPFRWVPVEECFSFWKTEVRPRVVDPQVEDFYLEDFPGEYAYAASEWLLEAGEVIVLLEVHH